ncbi:MAG TPA: outer membrane lipoprotein carrier protein LolA [Spirochaetota bacterium]|nr:outer membrane lipoprotein carrier protein LolA [Spirochaetota bacterium]HOD14121.1 outer membrane lipoprotein carrier protein LolA [Spirochaetota bacterium]HPG49168.1 outer membrane lipoprotein carrier protein LolA [Spirochaetota bacterium]HPN10782.1 outer membrane lipoprotein carrier protein LolA [Spirochaetota bacterium]HQL81081.1 outer membrane lipoprotein carrier protein LolA [Spirochaetota bacterium]
MKFTGKAAVLGFISGIILAAATGVYAFKFDFTTVSDIVDNIKSSFGKMDTYQADFTIVSEKMGKTTQQGGIIKYKADNKLCIEFSQPHGQKIVSNGKMMWIYIPSMNVVAEQDLNSDNRMFSSGTKSGLTWMFSKYHYRFASKEQPEPQEDGTKRYTLILKQKESRSGFRTMKLWVTERYFIIRAQGETSTGKKVDIRFSNLKTNISIPNGVFKFDIPARARVIKNPMISEE